MYRRVRNVGLFMLGAVIVIGSLVSARLFGADPYGVTGGTASADAPGDSCGSSCGTTSCGGGGGNVDPSGGCGCGDSCGCGE